MSLCNLEPLFFMTNKTLIERITNIRYVNSTKVGWDFLCDDNTTRTFQIADPCDVMLVGYPGATNWIAKHYGFMLINFM